MGSGTPGGVVENSGKGVVQAKPMRMIARGSRKTKACQNVKREDRLRRVARMIVSASHRVVKSDRLSIRYCISPAGLF